MVDRHHYSLHTTNKTQNFDSKQQQIFLVSNNKGLTPELEGRNCLFRDKKLYTGVKF